jgi:hypothetical protein
MDSTGSNTWTALLGASFRAPCRYATHPCHVCDVENTQQREIARANVYTVKDICYEGSLSTAAICGATKLMSRQRRDFKLGPGSATCACRRQYGRSHQANRPCLMHSGPLEFIRTMVCNLGKDFIEHVNDATSNLPGFSGIL